MNLQITNKLKQKAQETASSQSAMPVIQANMDVGETAAPVKRKFKKKKRGIVQGDAEDAIL